MTRLGIFGGTFDPIHNGHLFIAQAVAHEARLDRVLFLPVGDPAHRTAVAHAADRQVMVELAIAGNDAFALDDTALVQPGPVYTADTMPLLRAAYPNAALCFIAGADSLVDTPWRRFDEVLSHLETFYVALREGTDIRRLEPAFAGLPPDLARRCTVLNLPLVDVSSTVIRKRVRAGQPIRYLVPDAVLTYINRQGLYREAAGE